MPGTVQVVPGIFIREEDLNSLTADKLEGILAFANKAASITTSRRGAIPAMPTLTEVEG